jgi:FdhD protein
MAGPVTRRRGLRIDGAVVRGREEQLATEEPLEIRAGDRRLAVTMRTPGADFELAAGWLHGEGVVTGPEDLRSLRYCSDADLEPDERFNVVTAELSGAAAERVARLAPRGFVVSSACGVCGRETVADLRALGRTLPGPDAGERLDPGWLAGLPEQLRARQAVFDRTGGLHAAGLFDPYTGTALVVREDVGRHNAVDKVIGWALLGGAPSLTGTVLVVSGRASFEIVQKALAAGIPALVAVSAPSSLAVDVAREFGMALVGFVRDGRITVYSGEARLALPG